MSPASYRAAPPRVGKCKPYANRTDTPNPSGCHCFRCAHGLEVALGPGAAVPLVAAGFGSVTEPEGAAAIADAVAACSRFCASPYAAKSPFFKASCPSVKAFCASTRAAFNAGVVAVPPVPVPPPAAGGVVVVPDVESAAAAPELPPKSASRAPPRVSDHASWLPKATTIARANGYEDPVLALT